MSKVKLSIVIPTYNEDHNIGECIRSVKWADEIIVVDANSTDKTRDICRRAGVTLIDFLGKNRFCEPQRWFGIQSASHNWILCLDADERPSDLLKEEILNILNFDISHEGFIIPFIHFIFGKRMKYGGLDDNYLLRLIRRDAAFYPMGGVVHEQLHVRGTIGQMKNPILHYGTRDFAQYFQKMNLYTSLTAEKLFKQGVRIGYLNAPIYFVLKPVYYFLKRSIFQMGILDGPYGLALALLTAFTVIVNHLKLMELQYKEKQLPNSY